MAGGIAEISVRTFFTSEDGVDLAPQISLCFPIENLAEVSWARVLPELVAKAREALDGVPVEGVRPMTEEETAAFRAAERDE